MTTTTISNVGETMFWTPKQFENEMEKLGLIASVDEAIPMGNRFKYVCAIGNPDTGKEVTFSMIVERKRHAVVKAVAALGMAEMVAGEVPKRDAKVDMAVVAAGKARTDARPSVAA